MHHNLKPFLDECVEKYEKPAFIQDDPISIPHRFTRLQDIEIMAFWVSMLAWGKRKTIIQKSMQLIDLMDNTPYDFIKNHQENDRKRFLHFKHRTFQPLDALYFVQFFQTYYQKSDSLETAFAQYILPQSPNIEASLLHFNKFFFSLEDVPNRTRKHVSTPATGSACKRLNMFLRWMVRSSAKGVDFGLWQNIRPAQLLMPLDVHVERVARKLQLLEREKTDHKAVLELTAHLRQFDPDDPVKYDFALFGLGVQELGLNKIFCGIK
jgi:uncharacterized protein (TIGR02757 family)